MQAPRSRRALRRDRWIVVLALLVITALALGYTFWLATGFDMSGMMSPDYVPWSAGYFAFMLVMWIVDDDRHDDAVGRAHGPAVRRHRPAGCARQDAAATRSRRRAGFSRAIYWHGPLFALAATLLQWLLEWLALVTPMMAGTSRALGGVVLIAAGVYQWLPAKQACLDRVPRAAVLRAAARWLSARRAAARCGSVCCTASTASAAAGR